ncbi:MAG: GNAT family N-acetyltransferase [Defluviitaleaceae bacterium]|nr:GNAT family N-acetyltransferase [Defluviitaleaceae bacterium]
MKIQEPTKDDIYAVELGLYNYNKSKVPFTQTPESFRHTRVVKDGERVVAGIIADVYLWKILSIDILWVDEEYRGRGYGEMLMNDTENAAREFGCTLSHLDTFDFQAREFYEKIGYTIFGTLEDCPEGHKRYYMSKKL